MAVESLENPLIESTDVYVRDEWYKYFKKIRKNKNVKCLPELPFTKDKKSDHPDNWGSGPYAVLVACLDYDEIYLSGFDLYSKTSSINNIYKGTNNYQDKNSRPVNPAFWVYQLFRLFDFYNNKNFYIINEDKWIIPKEWILPNVKKIDFLLFEHLTLNNKSV